MDHERFRHRFDLEAVERRNNEETMKEPCFVGARRVGGLFLWKPTLPSTRLARHRKTALSLFMDWSWIAHGLLMEKSLIPIDGRGEAGGWLDRLSNNVSPARLAPT